MAETDLRQPGAILLASCYELGHQPAGIALPLAFLERAGYAPDCLDISVDRFDTEKIRRARFVGISVPMHTALRLGVRLAQYIREINPQCRICFYGLYASLNSEYLLETVADAVIGGEFEGALVSLVDWLQSGAPQESNLLAGVARRGHRASPVLERLSFPAPSRRLLPPLERYARLEHGGKQRLVGYVEASRGCLHHCFHCPIPPVYRGRFFVIPAEVILEDIRRLVQAGATHITFGDPDFLNGPKHSLRVVRKMHSEFPHLTFDFTAKVEHILKHRSRFSELGALGCIFIVSALESLSDIVLANLNKGHTRADIYAALSVLRSAGIELRPSFVAFTPWTALDDYIDMLEFVADEGLIYNVDPVQYTIRLLIPPGSALLDRPETGRYLGPLVQESFSYVWTHADPRMDELHQIVSAAVENAVRVNEDPLITFDRVRELAYQMRGEAPPAGELAAPLLLNKSRPPRLTEPWFC